MALLAGRQRRRVEKQQCGETCQRFSGVDVAAPWIILPNRPVWLYQRKLEGHTGNDINDNVLQQIYTLPMESSKSYVAT